MTKCTRGLSGVVTERLLAFGLSSRLTPTVYQGLRLWALGFGKNARDYGCRWRAPPPPPWREAPACAPPPFADCPPLACCRCPPALPCCCPPALPCCCCPPVFD